METALENAQSNSYVSINTFVLLRCLSWFSMWLLIFVQDISTIYSLKSLWIMYLRLLQNQTKTKDRFYFSSFLIKTPVIIYF